MLALQQRTQGGRKITQIKYRCILEDMSINAGSPTYEIKSSERHMFTLALQKVSRIKGCEKVILDNGNEAWGKENKYKIMFFKGSSDFCVIINGVFNTR